MAFAFEAVERRIIRGEIALAMGDRYADHLARLVAATEDRLRILDAQMNVAADKAQRAVGEQGAGQHPSLGQYLEPIADAEHRHALRGASLYFAHDRRVRRHRAAAQLVAIGEPAGEHD